MITVSKCKIDFQYFSIYIHMYFLFKYVNCLEYQ